MHPAAAARSDFSVGRSGISAAGAADLLAREGELAHEALLPAFKRDSRER